MTKTDIVKIIQYNTGLSKKDSTDMFESEYIQLRGDDNDKY